MRWRDPGKVWLILMYNRSMCILGKYNSSICIRLGEGIIARASLRMLDSQVVVSGIIVSSVPSGTEIGLEFYS